ncbi:alpha-glucosidase/alpha-galactosidase [Desmospora activa]|uniref:Alpha-galactosidase n=1 Tax=Desmospora activa DSM 45169 TaxID=1121389 RepID=A0A2T4Z7U9_9BACL|nr:alpha-glucosidase/alpha-galactosidase [Desmospora activa]PTM57954.1 alpha-galactosidase [Desmospora activa DSM 45169]
MPKITFIGAGSAVFTRNLLGDLLTYPELAGSRVCLMDIDAKRLGMVEALAKRMVEERKSNLSIQATTDRREALRDADYVIITIQVGGLEAYKQDIEIPQRYGVEQCVGDTMGPGGVFRGLRHLAVIEEIARELEELSPDALILQYTNPMAMIGWALSELSPLKTVGLCHSVQGTAEELAGYIGAPDEEISYWVAGINHVAWFLKFEWKGEDAYPLLFEKMKDQRIYGQDPVRFDLLRHFQYFVTESSGHASEYYPYFRKNKASLEKLVSSFTDRKSAWFDFGRSGGYLRHCYHEAEHYETDITDMLSREEMIEIRRSREYGAQIIHGIETNQLKRINGNVRNTGLITNLPEGCCVEVPCLVDQSGVQPCHVGSLPPQLAALIRTNVNMQELAVWGHIHRDKDLIYQAIKMDPLTSAVCSLDEVDSLVGEMFAAQAEWLPQFNKWLATSS